MSRAGTSATSSSGRRWTRADWAALALIVVVSSTLRLARMDLVEFKSDESGICTIAANMIEQGGLATHGLVSGTGLSNFPMFAYLLVPFVAASREPMFLTAMIALANVAAVALTYVGCAHRWGRGVAFWSALLMSCSPLAVLYSRKIWAQDVLPVLLVPAVFGLLALLNGEKKRIFSVVLLCGVAAMTHLSGLCAILSVATCLLIFRPTLCWKRLGVAVVTLAILASPFAYYVISEGQDERELFGEYLSGRGTAEELKPSLVQIVRHATDIAAGNLFAVYPEATPDDKDVWGVWGSLGGRIGRFLFAMATLALIVRVVLRTRSGRRKAEDSGVSKREASVLLVWLAIPILVYWVTGVRVSIHYFIVTFPVPFVVMGLFLDHLRQAGRRIRDPISSSLAQALPVALGLGVCISGVVSTVTFASQIDRSGGAAGDYGVALKHKLDAVEYIQQRAGGARAILVGDFEDKSPLPGAEEFEYLLRLREPVDKDVADTLRESGVPFVIVDVFRYKLTNEELDFVDSFSPK